VLVAVTASGERLCTRIQRDLVAETQALLSDFEPAVRKAAPALLRKLAQAAERRMAAARCAPSGACCP
jgi:hypothetical protein